MDMYFNKTELKAYKLLQKTGIRGRILLQTLIVPSSAQKYFRRLENPQYFILYTRSWHRNHLEPDSKPVRISSPYVRFIFFMLPSNLRQYISTLNIQASCDVELGPPLSTDVSKGLTSLSSSWISSPWRRRHHGSPILRVTIHHLTQCTCSREASIFTDNAVITSKFATLKPRSPPPPPHLKGT
jgi:hypothetical protein